MRHILQKMNQAGDTIVEVMIVLSVLSLALTISFATASRGLGQSRNAQEHSEALGILNSQLELLRAEAASPTGDDPAAKPNSFCLVSNTDPKQFSLPFTPKATATDDSADAYHAYPTGPAGCVKNVLYHVSTTYNAIQKSFHIVIRWDGTGSLGPQQEEITYKLQPLASIPAEPPFIDTPILGCPAGSIFTGTPPGASCVLRTFNWLKNDPANYVSPASVGCTKDSSEQYFGDSADGCFTTGNSVFMYRAYHVLYDFSSGATTGSITAGTATVKLNYQQYAGNSVAPYPAFGSTPAYGSFQVRVTVLPDSNPSSSVVMTLPIESTVAESHAAHSVEAPITVPTDGPVQIRVDWINNTNPPGASGDPNLQINSIQVYAP